MQGEELRVPEAETMSLLEASHGADVSRSLGALRESPNGFIESHSTDLIGEHVPFFSVRFSSWLSLSLGLKISRGMNFADVPGTVSPLIDQKCCYIFYHYM
jgi:hypothetical protein